MLATWLLNNGSFYLRSLFNHELPPAANSQCPCRSGNTHKPIYKCRDCFNSQYECQDCIVRRHQQLPCHRVRRWNGRFLERVALIDLGCVLALGEHQQPCRDASEREILVGSMQGFHRIKVSYSRCAKSVNYPSEVQQLLHAGLFPCSDDRPSTAFSFDALRINHLASTEGKISGGRLYAILVSITNSAQPHLVDDRYREFLRTSRQWMMLQTHKRSGTFDLAHPAQLVLRCPACPRMGLNFMPADVNDQNRYL